MFQHIVRFAVTKKLFVGLTTLFLLAGGIYAMLTLPVDAVPDITNNQVQIVTVSPTLAPQEVEQLITFPIEVAMSNIMNVVEIRSVSRFGLSVVTVVFKESVPILDARQLINEQIQTVAGEIPPELGTPEMMPITTGLGEIYQYTLDVAPGYEDRYDAMELRTIQDWIVKRQLSGIPGIVEINSFGGYLKQYEVAVDPDALYSLNITIGDVFEALSRNNQNTGGSYIEKVNRAYYIRSEGMISSLDDIRQIVVANRGGIPIHISDVATVKFGSAKRFGAMTRDGKGECVGGIAMMLKGANANVVTRELEDRVAKIQKMLPEGVSISPYLNRSELVNRNISTVIRNLIEGAIIVFLVLILFLGNVRAGLIVASVIPLAMLFAFILMRLFGVSANLMSLGAIDFGIVVDGSIVIVEGILAHLYSRQNLGTTLSRRMMDEQIIAGAGNVVRSATFAVIIILIVFFPILTLTGIEGKYFTPMAKTLVFCIIGALILSLTYVPMMASLVLKRRIGTRPTFADRFFAWLNRIYQRCLAVCLRFSWATVGVAVAAFIGSLMLFTRLGAEFIPTLDEGDFAMQMTLPAGSSLTRSIALSEQAEQILMTHFPEIRHVVAKIGTAEVPTDPMAVEDADVMIVMKPFAEWTSASSRAEMVEKMKAALDTIPGAEFNFSQPIQLRFNELMTGAKADIAIKLYGEDMAELYAKAKEAARYVEQVPGASDVLVEQAMGLPQLVVNYNRAKIARYGINIEELNSIIRSAYAGETAGTVFENERRFDLVVRLDQRKVADLNLDRLFIRTAEGIQIPVSEVATIDLVNGPLQINRDATKRRVVIGVNVRDADIQQVVAAIRRTLEENVQLKPGYYFEYGGQFENLQNAIRTLLVVIPVALMLILLLLFFAFKSVTYTLVVFSTVPLSIIGGILALWLRGLPFSISAGVGFIALFGVAVLNGILMINHFNDLRDMTPYPLSTRRIIARGTQHLPAARIPHRTGRLARIRTDGHRHLGRSRGTAPAGDRRDRRTLRFDAAHALRRAGILQARGSRLAAPAPSACTAPLPLPAAARPVAAAARRPQPTARDARRGGGNGPGQPSPSPVGRGGRRAHEGPARRVVGAGSDDGRLLLRTAQRHRAKRPRDQHYAVGRLAADPLLQECARPARDRDRDPLHGARPARDRRRGQTRLVLLPLHAGVMPALRRPERPGRRALAHERAALRAGRHHPSRTEHDGHDGRRDAQPALPGTGGAQGGGRTPAMGLLCRCAARPRRQSADPLHPRRADLGRGAAQLL